MRNPFSNGYICFLFLCFFGLGALPMDVFAFLSPVERGEFPEFPETVFSRRSYLGYVTGPISEASRLEEELVEEPGEDYLVGVFSESSEEEVRFYFSSAGKLTSDTINKGDYEISKSTQEGEFTSLKIYLKNGGETYLLLKPINEDYSRMDIYLLDTLFQRDIRVPYEFEDLLRISFSSLMKSTAGFVDWGFYIPDPIIAELDTAGILARSVRPYLSNIGDAEDGAIDKTGRYVYISDGSPQTDEQGLNCSGFVKWLVDGMYYLKTESLLSIDELKTTHPEVRGHRWSERYEEERQPYFGLDWTRNLAASMQRLTDSKIKITDADVDRPTYHEYKENIGYPIPELKTLLYELAVEEPEYIYLGSVNGIDQSDEGLRTHFHVVALFPWIDFEGRLQVSIMERGVETPIDVFIDRYREEFIHLVRIKSEGAFSPSAVDPDPVLHR